MSRAIRANYDQKYLFPPCLEDWVSADHPARFLRELVGSLDLQELGFRQSSGGQGRPHYGSDLLLKAWLYGYLNKIRSSRQLERACRNELPLIWLLGCNEPDHNTLWRFWRENRKRLRKLFVQVLRVAQRSGLVGSVLHAIDGTRIEAVESTQRSCREKRLRKELEKMEDQIDQLEKEIEKEAEPRGEGYRLPEELQDRQRLRARIRQELSEVEKEQGGSDARMQKMGGVKRLGYNAQVVVDGESQLIVAEEVVGDENDSNQLIPLLDQTQENLGEVAQDTVADGGYRTGAALSQAQAKDYSVLVRLQGEELQQEGYHWTRFEYDKKRDVCICPRAKLLRREGGYWDQARGLQIRTYRCTEWRHCPQAEQCSSDPRGRKVRLNRHSAQVIAQRRRQLQPENQDKLKRRKAIVERSFAEIKQQMGFRRWTYRGLQGARTQWAMICTAYNLKRLLAQWTLHQTKQAVV